MSILLQRLQAHFAKVVIVALLATPALVSVLNRQQASHENRNLTAFPARPDSWDAALHYPAKLDLWINDHFGFRDWFIRLNNKARYVLFRQFPTIQVIEGRNRRIFLSAHATDHAPYSAILLNCGERLDQVADGLTERLNRFAAGLHQRGIDARMMIVPSASIVYSDELPRWLERRCHSFAAPLPQLMASPRLHDDAKALLYYPLDRMRALRRDIDVIPKTWFHWAGAGPRMVAKFSAEDLWRKDTGQARPMVTGIRNLPSDISHLFPGITLESPIEVADYPASGITQCVGAACFPEMRDITEKLGDVSRYVNDAAPAGRLVLVSDSFGQYVAGWYASYYREVVHVSTNNLDRLDPGQRERLRQALFRTGAHDNVLFLYHDGSLLNGRVAQDIGDWAL